MQAEKSETTKTITNLVGSILFVVGISVLVFIALSWKQPQRNLAKDFRKQLEQILQTVYNENFSKIEIKYDDPVLLSRNIYLTTDLDEKAATEIMMKLKYLESVNNKEAVNLYIETCGGYGGVMLANYIQTIECPVNTVALGYCCSAGSEVLTCGTGTRKAFNSSKIIIHIVQDTSGEIDDETYNAASLQEKVTMNFWKEHSKLPEHFYQTDSEIFYNLTAEEALKFGVIDEIIQR